MGDLKVFQEYVNFPGVFSPVLMQYQHLWSRLCRQLQNGRAVLEFDVNFEVDKEIEQVPMILVGDLRTKQTLDEVRIYCHHTYVQDFRHTAALF